MAKDKYKEADLERVGCFKYSAVEGAKANDIAEHVPEEIKEERYHRFMQAQQEISFNKLNKKVGQTIDVIIDEVGRREIIARSKYDAPEIDGLVYIKNNGLNNLMVGDIINVRVVKAREYDLLAELVA